ncbi:hypothetical protein [Diaphorobacter sp. HDW4B]|uniref:hypothetical protein n=1 Tax=Diaphorobacter sp. HDW4B TaxID=2714925 RepID=UPI00352D0343
MSDDALDDEQHPLAARILIALMQELQTRGDDAVSLPRLSKILGESASVLMREITLMSDAQIGVQRGPGWVRVRQEDARWRVSLTAAGRALMNDGDPQK